MIRLVLNTKKYTSKQTVGLLEVYKNDVFVCCFATLEQKWNNNKTSDSCIYPGFHIIEHYSSEKYPNALEIKDVHGRTLILIHNGNYYMHTEGCILIGITHTDINNDGYLDVVYSKKAINKLMEICDGETVISIQINR